MDDSTFTDLLTRKELIEAALSKIEGWLLVFGILVVVGVGGESIFGIRTWWNNRKLQTLQRSIETERASRTQQASDLLRHSTEVLENANLQLQDEILKLREKIADRRLSPKQRLTIAEEMRKFPPQSWQIVTFSGDGEAKGFSTDIETALIGKEGAGWPTPNRSEDQTGIPIRGILIELGPNPDTSTLSAAKSLANSLRAERIAEVDGSKPFAPLPAMQVRPGAFVSMTVGGGPNPNMPITVIVGRKP